MALSNDILCVFYPCSFSIHSKLSEHIGKTKPLRVACEANRRKLLWSISQDFSTINSDSLFSFKSHGAYQSQSGHISSVKLPQNVQYYAQKLEDVKHLMKLTEEENPAKSLIIVDAIQRLGLEYYFEEEIETILQREYVKTIGCFPEHHTLHDVSLYFRIFRQNGYYATQDVFSNFKANDGRFQETQRQDIRGLIEMYEAAQLRFEGENILDEVANLSSKLLSEYCLTNNNKWPEIIKKRLRNPYHKSIAKLTRESYLPDFGGMINGQWEKAFKQLAKMDSLLSQSVYQEEFLNVSRWWKDLGLARELNLARKQPRKWFTWSMAILINDLSLSTQRIELTKSIAFIYLIDDIFDLYGTLDELTIFTEAIHKWDYATIDMLPDYMKMCYKALLDTTNEISHTIYKMRGFNPSDYIKASWKSLCDAFLVEAKWFASGDFPAANEYLENGKVSSGVHVVLVHLFFLLGLCGTNGSGEINLNDTSELVSSVATILRLSDDLGSSKDENQDDKDGSYTKYYMKDHPSISVEQAREHAINMISSKWKSLNKECFGVDHRSASCFKKASLNFARMVPLMYSYEDNQQLPVVEEYAKSMLLI